MQRDVVRRFLGTRRVALAVTTIMALVGANISCGTSTANLPPISLTFDKNYPPPTVLYTGEYAGIAVDVENDYKGTGNVNWTCTPEGACGSFTPALIHSAVPTCYVAPATVPEGNGVTITATSVTDPTKYISAQITIVSGGAVPCP
jgi:hypothetical protein